MAARATLGCTLPPRRITDGAWRRRGVAAGRGQQQPVSVLAETSNVPPPLATNAASAAPVITKICDVDALLVKFCDDVVLGPT
jgi:hypothetical protein